MAHGKHWYRISITSNVREVRKFLYKNKLIKGVEGNPTPSMTEGIVDIVVIVRNKERFEEWYSPKKRFREATDPILLGFIEGDPVELPDKGSAEKLPARAKSAEGNEFNKLKNKYDCRK
jgi:hypothetical protein